MSAVQPTATGCTDTEPSFTRRDTRDTYFRSPFRYINRLPRLDNHTV
jgi:hypothetical protein